MLLCEISDYMSAPAWMPDFPRSGHAFNFPPPLNFLKVNDRAGVLATHFTRYRVDGLIHDSKFLNSPDIVLDLCLLSSEIKTLRWTFFKIRQTCPASLVNFAYSAVCRWISWGEGGGSFSIFVHGCHIWFQDVKPVLGTNNFFQSCHRFKTKSSQVLLDSSCWYVTSLLALWVEMCS